MKTLLIAFVCTAVSISAAEENPPFKTPFRAEKDGYSLSAVATGEKLNHAPSPPLTLANDSLGNGELNLTLPCEQVRLTTHRGTGILAYRPINTDPYIRFSSAHRDLEFTNFLEAITALRIAPGDIVLGYNCHGVTFARSQFIIDNDQIPTLLESDYDECPPADAEVVVFYNHDSVVHSAPRIQQRGEFVFIAKAGVRGVQTVQSVEAAACGLAHDAVRYFRMKGAMRAEP
jgi:hypothetical protein